MLIIMQPFEYAETNALQVLHVCPSVRPSVCSGS